MAIRDKRWYTSLDAAKNELGLSDTTHDGKLKRYIERASAWVESWCHRWFIPITATRRYDFQESYNLWLDADLLAVTTLTNGDGAVLVDGTDFYKYPLDDSPYTRLEIVAGTSKYFTYQTTKQRAISLLGRWGYSEGYEDTGTTLGAAITSTTATTFTSSSGASLEVGWCLLIDSEQLWIKSISSNTVTVQRGNNGTTAATHSNGATVYRYVPEPAVEEVVVMLASTWYNLRDAGGVKSKQIGDFEVAYGGGDAAYPVPDAVRAMLDGLVMLDFAVGVAE